MKIILKKSRWFTIITTLCFVAVTLFAVVGCDKADILPAIDFTPCQQNKMKSSSKLSDKVDVEFTGKGIQITYYDFEVPCDFTTVSVTHTLVNGVLNISQQGTPNMADCICYTDVSYTLDGISRDEVNVIFINGVQVYCYNENDINNPCECDSPIEITLPIAPVDKDSLIGKWELCKYVNLQTSSFTVKPNNITKSVVINFLDFTNVSGNSLANSMKGEYTLISNSIKFIDLEWTLVNEPEWGTEFVYALYSTDSVKIEKNTLFLFYNQSKKVMLFNKLNQKYHEK